MDKLDQIRDYLSLVPGKMRTSMGQSVMQGFSLRTTSVEIKKRSFPDDAAVEQVETLVRHYLTKNEVIKPWSFLDVLAKMDRDPDLRFAVNKSGLVTGKFPEPKKEDGDEVPY